MSTRADRRVCTLRHVLDGLPCPGFHQLKTNSFVKGRERRACATINQKQGHDHICGRMILFWRHSVARANI